MTIPAGSKTAIVPVTAVALGGPVTITASAPGVGYHVNYVGAGPLPHPTLGFAVRVTHQPSSSRVRDAGAEVLATLLEELGRRRR